MALDLRVDESVKSRTHPVFGVLYFEHSDFNIRILYHRSPAEGRASAGCPTTRFPSLDGRGLRGGWSDKILISQQFYHPHPDPPPSRGRAISGIARVIGQPVSARPAHSGIGTARPPRLAVSHGGRGGRPFYLNELTIFN
jgi:hypothetical protein